MTSQRQVIHQLLPLLVAIGCATPQGEVLGRIKSDTLRLDTGDSVEFQAQLPAVVAGEPSGRLYIYYPFGDLEDSLRLRRIALGVFMYMWPELTTDPPPFVVLRAVNLPTAKRTGRYDINAYAFVVEPRADGHWYFMGESEPVR